MPDVAMLKDDFRRVEAIDVVLSRLAVGIVRARCEDDWQTVRDGLRLADAWLDKRLKHQEARHG